MKLSILATLSALVLASEVLSCSSSAYHPLDREEAALYRAPGRAYETYAVRTSRFFLQFGKLI